MLPASVSLPLFGWRGREGGKEAGRRQEVGRNGVLAATRRREEREPRGGGRRRDEEELGWAGRSEEIGGAVGGDGRGREEPVGLCEVRKRI